MPATVRLVSLLLFVSGMCALVFQTAWLREFRLIFGASTPASAAVLAIFMGGLGCGNAWLGPRADRSANPLRLYGQLEIAISLAAVVSPYLVAIVRSFYFALGGQESLGVVGATAVRLLLSAAVIGLPVFLMGGTLAAAARAVTADGDDSRRSVGWLYGLNTLGAVLGAILSTFWLLETLGTRETLWAAAALNLLNGCAAFWLSARVQGSGFGVQEENRLKDGNRESEVGATKDKTHRKSRKVSSPADPTSDLRLPASDSRSPPPDSRLPAPGLYAVAGIVGFAFLLMELVWYRMLGPILGGTTFTFGLILAVALAGIGVGGALYPLVYARRTPTLRDLGLSCGWEALAMAAPLALGDRVALLAIALGGLRYFGFAGQVTGWAVIALIVVFPAAIVSGLQFPLLVALLGRGRENVGQHLGRTYAWNTAGSVLGSLAGGFGLLPLLSAPGAWRLAIMLLALTALAIVGFSYRADRNARPLLHPLATLFAAALCLLAVGPTAVWRHSSIGAGRSAVPISAAYNDIEGWMHDRRRNVAWQADGAECSVAISTGGGVAFLVNGKSDGSAISDAPTQIMFPLIGFLVHADPREALVIGLGTGESAGWLAAQPQIERVDVVEIEPAIAAVAEACAPLNHDVLRHPKVRLVYNDARELVQTTRRQYDLIASEPSNPYRAGVAGLYTVDFYDAVRRRLKPGGLFVQWLQGYEIDTQAVRTVLATLRQAFPHVEIWETKPGDLVLVCGTQHPGYDLARLRSRLEQPAMRAALRVGWRTSTVEGILSHYVANEKFATAAAGMNPWLNTDNRNVLEFSFARQLGQGKSFTSAGLRREVAAAGMSQATTIPREGVDWEAVEDRAIAYYTALGDQLLELPTYAGERGKRSEALTAFFYDNPGGIATAWEAQKRQPADLIEQLALAYGYACSGSDKARPLLDRLRGECATDALILESLLLARQKRTADAIAQFERACEALRTDATALRRFGDLLSAVGLELVQQDVKLAARISAALAKPFAVYAGNERRLIARCALAEHQGPPAVAAALAEIEPNVPWNLEFLEIRYSAYQKIQHPLARRAERDLFDFRLHMPESRVLVQQ